MTTIAHRESLGTIDSGAAGMLLGGRSPSEGAAKRSSSGVALLRGTMNLAHSRGHRMSGWVETGIEGGLTLCSLIDQDAENPAVLSIDSEPCIRDGALGARVTVELSAEPVGEVSFSLLHIAGGSESRARFSSVRY